jgi:NAD(P)-dependent dehydrogenase (short-subunit alcohol dehydrogenase family)
MDKIALVTGSTSNVGKGVAEALAQDDFLVIVTSRHGDEAKGVADHLAKTGDYYEVDFSDAEQVNGLFSFVKTKYGRLDVLVNNVAYTRNESILDCSLEVWEKTINTNLRSYYLCTKLAAEIMKEQGGGNIVNITTSGKHGSRNKFSYSVSKGGINTLTMSAAVDLAAYNIRVNAVSINVTGTPVGHREFPERTRKHENPGIPAGHIGYPSDVANAVSFLVSEKARYIYGSFLAVDGGTSISH